LADLNDLRGFMVDLNQTINSPRFLKQICQALIKRIRVRTRLGKGAKPPEGDRYPTAHKLPKLKDKTILRRKRMKRAGKLTGPGARPPKSGINRTGGTLNQIHIAASGREVSLRLGQKGKRIAIELAKINPDFEFFNLSKAEFNFLRDEIQKEVDKILKRRLG